ncbi:unnamed protein product, partial [Mesorhabditis spiculigera]
MSMEEKDFYAHPEVVWLRRVTIAAIVLIILAGMLSIVAVPIACLHLQRISSTMQDELGYCRLRTHDLWDELLRVQVAMGQPVGRHKRAARGQKKPTVHSAESTPAATAARKNSKRQIYATGPAQLAAFGQFMPGQEAYAQNKLAGSGLSQQLQMQQLGLAQQLQASDQANLGALSSLGGGLGAGSISPVDGRAVTPVASSLTSSGVAGLGAGGLDAQALAAAGSLGGLSLLYLRLLISSE